MKSPHLLLLVPLGVIAASATILCMLLVAALGLAEVFGAPFWAIFIVLMLMEVAALRLLPHQLRRAKSVVMGLLASYGAVVSLGLPAWVALLAFLLAPYLLLQFLARSIIQAGKLAFGR